MIDKLNNKNESVTVVAMLLLFDIPLSDDCFTTFSFELFIIFDVYVARSIDDDKIVTSIDSCVLPGVVDVENNDDVSCVSIHVIHVMCKMSLYNILVVSWRKKNIPGQFYSG